MRKSKYQAAHSLSEIMETLNRDLEGMIDARKKRRLSCIGVFTFILAVKLSPYFATTSYSNAADMVTQSLSIFTIIIWIALFALCGWVDKSFFKNGIEDIETIQFGVSQLADMYRKQTKEQQRESP